MSNFNVQLIHCGVGVDRGKDGAKKQYISQSQCCPDFITIGLGLGGLCFLIRAADGGVCCSNSDLALTIMIIITILKHKDYFLKFG